jgi:HEAT repeat protein
MTVGQLKLRGSAAFVEPLLEDPEPRVRAAAIYALAQCGRNPDPSALGTMLMDNDPRIRSEAARIIGLLGNASAIPMLKSSAAEADRRNRMMGGASDQQFQLERIFQLQVAEALSRLGEPNASDPIRASLYPTGREGLEAAAFAAQLLGDLKVERAVAELVDLVEQATPETAKSQDYRQRQFVQPKEVRLAAATALAKMGYRDGLYVAEQFRADEDPAVRAQAAFLFAAGARVPELPALESMMDDPSPVVAVAGASAVLKALDRLER